jgi:hypothetical protein
MTQTATRTCARCGAEIVGRNGRAKFCSDTCNNRAQHEKWRRRDGQEPRVDTHCEGCLHLRDNLHCMVYRARHLVPRPCPAKRTTQAEVDALRQAIADYAGTHGG